MLPVGKKRPSAREAVKEINDVEGPGTVNERVVQNWFRRFNEGDGKLEEKPKFRETC